MLPMAVARSSSCEVTKRQGEGAILGVFFPIDNALYSIAFGTHTKTTEPIGPKEPRIRWGCKSPREGALLVVVQSIQKHCQSSLQISLRRRCCVHRKRDHAVANNVMQQSCRRDYSVCQASANNILKITWRSDAAYWPRLVAKGVVGLHSAGEVLPCLHWSLPCILLYDVVVDTV